MVKTSNLDAIADKVITMLSRKNEARERCLPLSREAIRHCANAIRAVHRAEFARAGELLETAHIRIQEMKQALAHTPDLRYGGFVFDAEKEYAEGRATMALVRGQPLPDPDELGVDYAAYVNGLGEAIGEMRRHLLDELRRGDLVRIEDLMSSVDDMYNLLISVDFPDAITSGLRRTTDVARSILEKTRGDITLAFQQRSLERRLREIETGLAKISFPTLPSATEAAEAATEAPLPPQPKRRRRRRRKPAAAAAEGPAPEAAVAAPELATPAPIEASAPPPPPAETAPKRRRRRRRKPAAAAAEGPAPEAAVVVPELVTPAPIEASAPPPPPAETAPKRRRRHRRRRPAPAEGETAMPEAGTVPAEAAASLPEPEITAPTPAPVAEGAPKRRWRRRRRPTPASPTAGPTDSATEPVHPEQPSS